MNFSDLERSLNNIPEQQLVFVGLGNLHRGDDGAGIRWLEHPALCNAFPESHFIFAGTTPENHLTEILEYKPAVVVFVDAARWGGFPGEMTWLPRQLLDDSRFSTHAYSIGLIETYLQNHRSIEIRYLGIQPGNTHPGASLSPVVQNAIDQFFNG